MDNKYTLKDFTIPSLRTNASDRSEQFQKWICQSKEDDHLFFWLEAQSAVAPIMQLVDYRTGKSKEVISFISNDYLGMSQRKEVIEAGIEGLKKYGAGACAAPSIGGYLDIHKRLEKEIAQFTGQEDALVFSSGFGVNVGVLNALLGKEDIAFIDVNVHTSVLDGLHNTNTKKIGHNNLDYLEFVLNNERKKYKTALVIIDGIYSQNGDMALLPEIIQLCKKYDALLYMDDAHGIGVFGENGRGVAEYCNVLGQVDIITGTLSKAFGTVGGFVACSKQMADYLRLYANTTVFSASMTPSVAFSVLKAIELIRTDKSILRKLWENESYLRKRLLDEGFDIGISIAPIFPIMIRDPHKVMEVSRMLRDRGIYAIGIVYPAVTNKESRVRVSLSAAHEIYQLDALIDALNDIDKVMNIKVHNDETIC